MSKATGSYCQRKDGHWKVKYKGRQYIVLSENAAKKKLRELRQGSVEDMASGNISKHTLRQAIEYWLTKIEKLQLKPTSYERKENTCKYQVFPVIGDIQIRTLSSTDMESMLQTLYAGGYSFSTIKKAYEVVNSCLNYYVRAGKLSHNPVSGVNMPKINRLFVLRFG